MSKSVKQIFTIVGIAALAFFTGGAALGLLGGGTILGSASVLGFSAGIGGLTLGAVAQIGLLALSIGTSPDAPTLESTGATSRGHAFADPDASGAYIFGRTAVPPAIVYEQLHGVNEDRITDIFAHAWHRIEAYVSLAVGGKDGAETITFSGTTSTGPGAWADVIEWRKNLGNPGQTAFTISEMAGGEFLWPATAVFEGVAHSALTWNFFEDPDGNKLRGGVPTQVEIVVDGAWMYDPRLDPTYGAGTQDYGTPSTWSYPSTNPGNAALVLLRMLIGEYTSGSELIWGRGADESEINMDTFVAMANVADESLDGGFRYSLAGMHLLDGNWEGFVQRWEQETGGKLYKAGGLYGVWLPHDDLTPLTAITEDDFLEGEVAHSIAGDISSLYNTGRGRYIEPTEGYRAFPYPEVAEATAIADDGEKRVLFKDFGWVQTRPIAERIVRTMVRRSRFPRLWTIPMGWKGMGPDYAPFTVHTLNCAETNDTAKLVRVVDRRMSLNGETLLVVQEEDVSIYDDTIPLGTAFTSGGISNRLDRLGTITSRYIDGTAIDDLKPAEAGATAGATAAQIQDITDAATAAANAQATADGKITTFVSDSPPTADGVGDFWLDSNDGYRQYRWDGTSWVDTQDGDIAIAIAAAAGAQSTADNKIQTFVGTSTPTAEGTGDLWVNPTTRQLKRWDGDSWEVATPAGVEDSADVTANHAANAVDNPEFEAGDVSWTIFAAWAIVESALNARRGSWAAQATSASADGLFNDQRLQVAEGDRVLAQGFAKRTSGSGSCQVWIRWYDSAGSSISTSTSNSVTSSSYAIMRVVGIAPANAVTAQFIFVGNSAFTGYADGAYMSIIGRESDAVYRQSTAPSHAEGRIWIDTDDLRVYRSTGTAWVQIATDDALLAGQNAPAEGGANITETRRSLTDWGATQTFTPGWTGFSTNPTGDMNYAISQDGRQAMLWAPTQRSGTSNSTLFTMTGIPAALSPTQNREAAFIGIDNGIPVPGRASLAAGTTAPQFQLAKVSGSSVQYLSSWTTSGTKGLTSGFMMIYDLE